MGYGQRCVPPRMFQRLGGLFFAVVLLAAAAHIYVGHREFLLAAAQVYLVSLPARRSELLFSDFV